MDNKKQMKVLKYVFILFLCSLFTACITTFMKSNLESGYEFTSLMKLFHHISYISTAGLGSALVFGYLDTSFVYSTVGFMIFVMFFWCSITYVKESYDGQYIVSEVQGFGETIIDYYERENIFVKKWSHREIKR